eukprot:5188552-Pyramimonas_sp.AAC.1
MEYYRRTRKMKGALVAGDGGEFAPVLRLLRVRRISSADAIRRVVRFLLPALLSLRRRGLRVRTCR